MGELTAPGFLLEPGEIVRILHFLDARAFGRGDCGALTDVSQTAQLRMHIPAGVVVTSRVPLHRITSTTSAPEPGTAMLFAPGLGAMAWIRLRKVPRDDLDAALQRCTPRARSPA